MTMNINSISNIQDSQTHTLRIPSSVRARPDTVHGKWMAMNADKTKKEMK